MSLIIVGAGITGITAATTLLNEGFEAFRVLEARSTLGGRAQKLDDGFADVALPLGSITPFADVAPFEQILFDPQDIQQCFLENNSCRNLPSLLPEFGVDNFDINYRGATIKDFLDQEASSFRDKLDLDTVVQTIDYSDPNIVSVITSTGTMYQADRVLLATPPTTLQRRQIQFNPPLPNRYLAAADRVEITTGIRAWFEFSTKFYPDLIIVEDLELEFRNAVFGQDSSQNILTFQFIEVPNEGPFVGLNDNQIRDFLLSTLDRLYNGSASANLIKSRIQNWGNEEFINVAINGIDESGTLRQPIDSRIFFAGEYVDEDFGEEIADRLATTAPPNPLPVKVFNRDGGGGVPVPSPPNTNPRPSLPFPSSDEDFDSDEDEEEGGGFGGRESCRINCGIEFESCENEIDRACELSDFVNECEDDCLETFDNEDEQDECIIELCSEEEELCFEEASRTCFRERLGCLRSCLF